MVKKKIDRFFKKVIHFFDYLNVGSFVYIAKDLCLFEKNNIYSQQRTLELIYEKNLSVSRFGDGEIDHCIYPHLDSQWQMSSIDLSINLSEILVSDNDTLITCIPGSNAYDRWWKRYWINNWFPFKNKLDLNKSYGNSFITRPEFFLTYKELGVELWKRIWEKKEVIFITGLNSRFQYGHILFDNISNYEVVYSKNKNAFSDFNRLLKILDNENNKEKLFLIALGQTGTVLAYHLNNLGYRSLDIGHIDRSYDYVFGNGKSPEKVSYK